MKEQKISIQSVYGHRFQHCWGCGPQNHDGIHIESYPSEDGNSCVAEIVPPTMYTGGVPDNLFGGMIAVLFDCHGTASAAWFSHHAKGFELTKETVIGRFITARLEVDFKKPVPIGKLVKVTSTCEQLDERKCIVLMEMESEGELRAKAKMVAVHVKDNM